MSNKKKPAQDAPLYVLSRFETAGEEMLAHLKLKASKTNLAIGPSRKEAGLPEERL